MNDLEFYGKVNFLKAGHPLRHGRHHRQPPLQPRDPDARVRLRPRRAPPQPGRRPPRHPQRRRLRRSGTRPPTRSSPRRSRRPTSPGRRPAATGCRGRSASRPGRTFPSSAWSPGWPGRRASTSSARPCDALFELDASARHPGHGRRRRSRTACSRREKTHPSQARAQDRLRRADRPDDLRGQRPLPHPLPLRAVRPDPDVRLKYGTIPVVRATGGLDDSIQEFDRRRRDRQRLQVRATRRPRPLVGVDPEGAGRVPATGPPGAALVRNAMAADFSWEQLARRLPRALRQDPRALTGLASRAGAGLRRLSEIPAAVSGGTGLM